MQASPKSNMGLTIHNATYYNTFDILALVNAFEVSLKRSQRIFHVSPLGTVDGQISLRDYNGKHLTERVYRTGFIGNVPIYVRMGHGANRGVYKLRKPGQMFDNDVQQLVWETADEKAVPEEFSRQLLEQISHAYSIESRYIETAIKRLDLSRYPIRVLKNRASPAAKGKGNSKQRRAARSALVSMEFRIAQAADAVATVITHFSPVNHLGETNHLYRDVMAVRGEFPELSQLTGILTSLNELRETIKASASSIIAPEFEKKETAE